MVNLEENKTIGEVKLYTIVLCLPCLTPKTLLMSKWSRSCVDAVTISHWLLLLAMPNVTVSSLKKENDSLKDDIGALKRNLEELQQSIKRQDPKASSNDSEPTRAITEAESLNTLELYGKSYDDLRAESANSLKQLWSRLNLLLSRVEKIGDSIEQLQRYSFQYNIKIIGLPESETQESASKTTSLCIDLIKAIGIEISNQHIDIAHRVPTRNATSGARPIVCKFTRRIIIVKEQVMNARNEACKVLATSIGLPPGHSLENVRLFDHLTPQLQQLLPDTKKFQKRNGLKFCWSKNFVIYLRRTEYSRPIQIKCHNNLANFANQESLPMR